MDIVILSHKFEKDLKKIPDYIQIKFYSWVEDVEKFGLEQIRKIKGYHDEPLKGQRKGQRSIRLSKSYRVIYVVEDNIPRVVEVIDINKHNY